MKYTHVGAIHESPEIETNAVPAIHELPENTGKTLPKRKNIRWIRYDYSTNGAYFLTIRSGKYQTIQTDGGSGP